MSTFKIITYPNPVLRKKAEVIEHLSGKQREILDKMVQTMHENEAVGVAAQQVDVDIRLAVINAGSSYGLLKLVNPVIVEKEGREYMEEGCLSLPGITVNVPRAKKIKVKAKNERGEEITFEVDGFISRIFQHEIDHLDGKVIIDYLCPIKKLFVLFKFYLKRLFKKFRK